MKSHKYSKILKFLPVLQHYKCYIICIQIKRMMWINAQVSLKMKLLFLSFPTESLTNIGILDKKLWNLILNLLLILILREKRKLSNNLKISQKCFIVAFLTHLMSVLTLRETMVKQVNHIHGKELQCSRIQKHWVKYK